MNTSTQRPKACPILAAITSGFLLALATTNAEIIFQADFNGPGQGTGGTNDLVTLGGTGTISADGVNVISYVTNASPFTAGGGNYLEVQRVTSGGGGMYTPVTFNFASDTNSWMAWQGDDIVDLWDTSYIALHGAFDVFFRVNSSNGTNDFSSFRTLEQYSWSDGGNGLSIRLNGQSGGWMILQIANAGFKSPDTTPQAIINFSGTPNSSYDANYDTINMFPNGNGFAGVPLTNGVVYHVAISFNTDKTGLTTANLYLKAGTGSMDSTHDMVASASFYILAANVLDWSGKATDKAFANQPFHFGVGWAADGPFVADYALPRIYNSVPDSFTALPGSPSESISSAPPQTNVIFEADFKGSGQGNGGPNDMVTLGGTSTNTADGVNVLSYVTNANPFVAGGGDYLEVQRLTTGGGGMYSPVTFNFASDTNSWTAWQGDDITDQWGASYTALHGAFDVFFRVNSSNGTNDFSSFRTLEQYSWSDGGNGLSIRLNGQSGGWMILQIANAGFKSPDTMPQAIINFNGTPNSSYDANYDTINMFPNGNGFAGVPLTNGMVYHVAISLNTDSSGLTTAKMYMRKGTAALDAAHDMVASASFFIVAANVLDWSGQPTSKAFANQPFHFGVGWAADGPFVADYASPRLYNSVPTSFTALPSVIKFLPPIVSEGRIILNWTGNAQIQCAPALDGPWTSIAPALPPPYSEDCGKSMRFYRLSPL